MSFEEYKKSQEHNLQMACKYFGQSGNQFYMEKMIALADEYPHYEELLDVEFEF